MAKAELWDNRLLGWFLSGVGCFPVHRDVADREALRRAQRILEHGQVLVLFPEGTRQSGAVVHDLFEGAAYIATRTGVPIVPVGIGGSEAAMPKGAKIPTGASGLGTAKLKHHHHQVTFDGKRLYTFDGDTGSSVNGNGVEGFMVATVP